MGKKLLIIGLMSLSLAVSSALLSRAFAEDKTIATVNGSDIKQSTLDALSDLVKRSNRTEQLDKKTLLEDLITTEVVRQEAMKAGLAEREDIKQKVKDFQDRLILNAWSQDKVKTFKISDDELKAAYDKRMADQPKTEYKARHILVKTEAEAKVIIDELKKGADFAELAKKKSTGPSGKNGGDLGWFSPNAMVAPFSEAVTKLEKGKMTEAPVKTKFGYHIIKLEDTRPIKLPSLDAIKPQLKRVIEQEKMKDYVDSLRAQAKVKILIDLNEDKKVMKSEKIEAQQEQVQATDSGNK